MHIQPRPKISTQIDIPFFSRGLRATVIHMSPLAAPRPLGVGSCFKSSQKIFKKYEVYKKNEDSIFSVS
jgi:hypothetical protein